MLKDSYRQAIALVLYAYGHSGQVEIIVGDIMVFSIGSPLALLVIVGIK